jgi:hypothetical protein
LKPTFYTGWAHRFAGDRDGEEKMRKALQMLIDMNYHLLEPLTRTLLAEIEPRDGRIDAAIAALDAQLDAIEKPASAASKRRCPAFGVWRLWQLRPPRPFKALPVAFCALIAH